jgi:hypothetical protein
MCLSLSIVRVSKMYQGLQAFTSWTVFPFVTIRLVNILVIVPYSQIVGKFLSLLTPRTRTEGIQHDVTGLLAGGCELQSFVCILAPCLG